MAEHIDVKEIKQTLIDKSIEDIDIFSILKKIALLINNPQTPEDTREVHEIILRLLEQKEKLSEYEALLTALVKEIGLYPYLDEEKLELSDRIAYEYNRPLALSNVVFHRIQSEVYRALLSGQNVILSAPTSFGKSLIIDAMIALKKFKRIVVVVPTIALLDETRRRFYNSFKTDYKIITNVNQEPGEYTIFILTQERVLEFLDEKGVDFFVIDEFYKINPSMVDNRSIELNQAFYKLLKTQAQFFMLGPKITSISGIPENIQCTFINTDYKTVISQFITIQTGKKPMKDLINLVKTLDEPTLIFCKSPDRVNAVAIEMINSNFFQKNENLSDAATWMKKNYHKDWLLPIALEREIGIHHGKIPRSLAQFCVRAFNEGKIKFLICTSTLIEGVNTKAKNVIIFDKKIADKDFDYFTFNNIAGRSGRMFQHFIGNVYLFHDPPESKFPSVDFPLFSQFDGTAERLLMQMEEIDLTETSKINLQKYRDQNILSYDTLKANSSVDPDLQLDLAKEIIENKNEYHQKLCWTGIPSYEQLELTSNLIWEHLVKTNRPVSGVSSGKQLAFKILHFYRTQNVQRMIFEEINKLEENEKSLAAVNKKIEGVLDFVRLWATFKFPQLLMVINSIQAEIYQKYRLRPGNYSQFAMMTQNLFVHPYFKELDEYGLPTEVSKKLQDYLSSAKNFDDVLIKLKEINLEETTLDEFEKDLFRDTCQYI